MGEIPRDKIQKNFIMAHTLDEEALAELRRKPLKENIRYNKRVETATKATQTDPEFDLENESMFTEEDSADESKGMEEETRSELNKTLADDEEMHQSLAQLIDENAKYKAMVEEANNFIQICRNLLHQYNDNDMELDLGGDSDDDPIKDIK